MRVAVNIELISKCTIKFSLLLFLLPAKVPSDVIEGRDILTTFVKFSDADIVTSLTLVDVIDASVKDGKRM